MLFLASYFVGYLSEWILRMRIPIMRASFMGDPNDAPFPSGTGLYLVVRARWGLCGLGCPH